MSNEAYTGTVRLTVAQATIRFLSNQYSERDGVEHRLIPGAFGIFGHGNVAGIGQALLQNEIARYTLLLPSLRPPTACRPTCARPPSARAR